MIRVEEIRARTEDRSNPGARIGWYAEDVPWLLAVVDQLAEALTEIAEQQQKTLGWIRANGIVFDGPLGTDPSNWQQVAFSIYSDLCEVDSLARSALAVLVSGEGTG